MTISVFSLRSAISTLAQLGSGGYGQYSNAPPALMTGSPSTPSQSGDGPIPVAGPLLNQEVAVATKESMESVAKFLAEFLQASGRSVAVSVDSTSGNYVIRVIDSSSGNLIRQVPSEEALALMRFFVAGGTGVLLSQRA